MGEEKERKGGERKKGEGAGTDERLGKSGRGERNKEGREKKGKKVWILIRCMACTRTKISVLVKSIKKGRLLCWSSDHDSTLPMQGAQDGYLVRQLDPTCRNWRSLTLHHRASILGVGWNGVGAWVGLGKLVTTRAGGVHQFFCGTFVCPACVLFPTGGLRLMCLASGVFSHSTSGKALSISFTLRHKWPIKLNRILLAASSFTYLILVLMANTQTSVSPCVLVARSCPTLFDPLECSLPGSSVHGILQARMLEWVAIPFSRGSSSSRDQTRVFCIAGRFFTIWATREALSVGQVRKISDVKLAAKPHPKDKSILPPECSVGSTIFRPRFLFWWVRGCSNTLATWCKELTHWKRPWC